MTSESKVWSRASEFKLNYTVTFEQDTKRLQTFRTRDPLPPSCTLSLPEPGDQGSLGACVSFALCKLFAYNIQKQNPSFRAGFSELMVYHDARLYENGGRDPGDIGLTIPGALASVAQKSVCERPLWPYVISKFRTRPSAEAIAQAKQNYALRGYYSVSQSLVELKSALVQGNPIVFGAMIYQSFLLNRVAETGIIPVPNTSKERFCGGHCILIAGYDDAKSAFLVQNHWGTDWGVNGYCWFPYAYMLNAQLVSDFRTTRNFVKLESAPAPAPAPAPVVVVVPFQGQVKLRMTGAKAGWCFYAYTLKVGLSSSSILLTTTQRGYMYFTSKGTTVPLSVQLSLSQSAFALLQQTTSRFVSIQNLPGTVVRSEWLSLV